MNYLENARQQQRENEELERSIASEFSRPGVVTHQRRLAQSHRARDSCDRILENGKKLVREWRSLHSFSCSLFSCSREQVFVRVTEITISMCSSSEIFFFLLLLSSFFFCRWFCFEAAWRRERDWYFDSRRERRFDYWHVLLFFVFFFFLHICITESVLWRYRWV